MCRRRGGLLAFFPREALTLSTPESNYGTYRFNKEHRAHHFWPTCGVAPLSEGADPRTGAKMVAVNVRCLPDVDLSALKVSQVDGASFGLRQLVQPASTCGRLPQGARPSQMRAPCPAPPRAAIR